MRYAVTVTDNTAGRRGRPRSFDREAALGTAVHEFWRSGYEGTSIAALTSAMGITSPSLYAAFGDKKTLFLEAVERYAGDPDELARNLDSAPTARHAVRSFLRASATSFTGPDTPAGCLVASAAASGSAASAEARRAVTAVRDRTRALLRERLERDRDGLPPGTDPEAIADLTVAVVQGMSVLARDGASRSALHALTDGMLAGWLTNEDTGTGSS